jgi:DNA-binding HxlR family transcriptional regulator
MPEQPEPLCASYTRAIEIIGRRWTGGILWSLMGGRTRFSEIAHAIPGLSDRLLSERLKELEAEGLVVRTVTACTPVRIDYSLTEKARALVPVLRSLKKWSETWLGESAATTPARLS